MPHAGTKVVLSFNYASHLNIHIFWMIWQNSYQFIDLFSNKNWRPYACLWNINACARWTVIEDGVLRRSGRKKCNRCFCYTIMMHHVSFIILSGCKKHILLLTSILFMIGVWSKALNRNLYDKIVCHPFRTPINETNLENQKFRCRISNLIINSFIK